jgi:hypothetical protein
MLTLIYIGANIMLLTKEKSMKHKCTKEEQTCEARINNALADRLKQFEQGELEGLCFDYVDNSETEQKSYHRWQLSWGGPSDEFRLFKDGTVKYWFLDWYDGASREVNNKELLNYMCTQAIENL